MSELNARIKPLKSSVAGEVPAAGDMDVAEIAVNTADGKLFVKHIDNSIKEISGSGGGGGTLEGLSDVELTALANMDGLVYNSTLDVWQNAALPLEPKASQDFVMNFESFNGDTNITDDNNLFG